MSLVIINELSIGFRGPNLLNGVSCRIDAGQRIGLLGRNGAGKTTLMRILGGTVEPDDGEVIVSDNVTTAFLPQDVPQGMTGSIRSIVAAGLIADSALADWERDTRTDATLSRMNLDGEQNFESLSSGMKRRVLLAAALVAEPDLLMLDEPTNHLDIEAIEWLENHLLKWSGSLMFVTHDRRFLQNLATRIMEIDRGQLFDWSCDYQTFLKRKEQALAAEEKQDALFDKRLAEEEVWIRQGIKARRTRNEGRVRALQEMRRERSERRSKTGASKLTIHEAGRSGNLVIEADEISFEYPDRKIFDRFSCSVMRGDKFGIIGPNGAGKTTLLKVLLGKTKPTSGKIKIGTNVEIAYFDQLRQQLDGERTVHENVGDGYDYIEINGAKKHVLGYLQDFLFAPERARTQVKYLSGGEQNRILLAKLFAKPANLIVLDEPTNDLDSETLELLEERLVAFPGTVLMVSHDRAFLNNVVTNSIVFERDNQANGDENQYRLKEYVGGYDDWIRQRPVSTTNQKPSKPKLNSDKRDSSKSTAGQVAAKPARRLKFKEQQELESLPAEIERIESEIGKLHTVMADPDFYQQHSDKIVAVQNELKELEATLATSYSRWEELESLNS